MNLIVRLPRVIERYAPFFEDLFSAEGYGHFCRFLSGLLVSENKTLESINRLFVIEPRNQSSLNRFINRSNFDRNSLSLRRVMLMQGCEQTRFKCSVGSSGVLSLDDSLLSHYGRQFDHIYLFWDHVDNRYTYAHNLVNLHYSDDQTDYPVDDELWLPPDWDEIALTMKHLGIHINEANWNSRKENPKKWRVYIKDRYGDYQYKEPALEKVYKSKFLLGLAMLHRFKQRFPQLKLPVAMDSGYTSAAFCKKLVEDLGMDYVGGLRDSQYVILSGSEKITLAQFKDRLLDQHHKKGPKFYKTTVHYKNDQKVYYAYCATHHIQGFPKQRLVISYQKEDFSDVPRYSICNRTNWHASGILRIRRHRWPIETYYQEGKAEGLDKYQLRNSEAIKTHLAFVSIAYTMLKRAVHDPELMSTFRQQLQLEPDGTLPFLRRLLQLEGLAFLIEYVHLHFHKGESIQSIFRQLIPSTLI